MKDFYEVMSLHSVTDNFKLQKFKDGDEVCLEIYHFNKDNGNKSTSWDNYLFTLNAHRILENYVKFDKICADDLDDFNEILKDIRKEDFNELYEMLSYGIELGYFKMSNEQIDEYTFHSYILKFVKQNGHILFNNIYELSYLIDICNKYNTNNFGLTDIIWHAEGGELYISENNGNIIYGNANILNTTDNIRYFRQLKNKFLNK